jgi:hydroxymethylglutaryl-CoA lyase
MTAIKLIECPRDAMQGWKHFIPTDVKARYINKLLEVGFDTIDFGSFVSAKAIPQLADTREVLAQLKLDGSKSKLLAIIANVRGASDATQFDEITYLGFPFSISETFQKLNTNSSIAESLSNIETIQELCIKHKKQLVTYISMGFGNPYGDEYSSEIAIQWVEKLAALGIRIFSLSDTVGVSNPENIAYMFSNLVKAFPALEFGGHFHSTKETTIEKIETAFDHQCFRFDSAINGIGGCPMAQSDLVGNVATETLISFLETRNIQHGLNKAAFGEALQMSQSVFSDIHESAKGIEL